MAAKTKAISLRVTEAQKAWLEQQEEATGNDASATIRWLLAQAMNGWPQAGLVQDALHAAPVAEREDRIRAEAYARELAEKERLRQERLSKLREQLEALERGEDIDEAPEMYEADPEPEPDEFEDLPPDPDGGVASDQGRAALKGPPFSLTQPVGMRSDLQGGSVIGDPKGNVIRENFRHMQGKRR